MDLTKTSPLNDTGVIPAFQKKFDLTMAMPADTPYKPLAEYLSDTNFIKAVREAKDLKPDPMQIVKGGAASAVTLTSGTVGTNLALVGRQMDEFNKVKAGKIVEKRSNPDYRWYLDLSYLDDSATLESVKQQNGPIAQAGQATVDFSNNLINKYLTRKPGLANQLMYDISGGVVSVGASFTLMRALGAAQAARAIQTAAPAAWFAAQAAGDVAQTGYTKGVSPKVQTTAYMRSAIPNYFIENIGMEYWLKALKGSKIAERVTAGVITNLGQESTQNLSDQLAMKLGGFNDNDFKTIIKGAAYEGLIGAISGGGVAAIDVAIEHRSIIGELRSLGISDAQIETAFNEVNNLGKIVVAGDLTKSLVAKGFDEVTANAVEE